MPHDALRRDLRHTTPPGWGIGLLAGLLLTGCSAGQSGGAGDGPSAAGSSASGGATGPAEEFNPCTDLSAAFVGRRLGSPVTEDRGTAADPRCAFLPTREGGPAMEVNYLVFTGPLDEIFATMGPVPGRVRVLDLPTAADARLVVNPSDDGIAVTGFVQTGGLVETVNTVALAPYDQQVVVAGTRAVMRRLSERAAARARG